MHSSVRQAGGVARGEKRSVERGEKVDCDRCVLELEVRYATKRDLAFDST